MSGVQSLSCHLTPLLAVVAYLAYPKQLRLSASVLHVSSLIHNGLLVLFSAWTFVSLSQIIYHRGVVFQSHFYFQDEHFDRIIYWFYLSKYYEFFDTFLLYLNGKSPIFLQKFHHVGAVICWHLHYSYKVDGVWIPSIANAFVHTVMYSYYLCCLLKIRHVRFIKKYITSLQLLQLIVPNFICLYYYSPPVVSTFHYHLIQVFVGYVSVLVVLFARFFHLTYLQSKREWMGVCHLRVSRVDNAHERQESIGCTGWIWASWLALAGLSEIGQLLARHWAFMAIASFPLAHFLSDVPYRAGQVRPYMIV